MKAIDLIMALLNFEEGYRAKPYYCSEGYPTVAIGWRIGPKGAPLENYNMYITKPVAKVLLADRVNHIESRLETFGWYSRQTAGRKAVLISMAYQMGVSKLFKFKNMIAALEAGDFARASSEAIDSLWYEQTKERATRHANTLKCGSLESVYGSTLEGYIL